MINKLLAYAGLLILLFLSTPLMYFWKSVSSYDNANPDQKVRKAAIVLGAATWDDEPSPGLQERLDTAHLLLKNKKVHIIVLSGGQGFNKDYSEAEVMKKYLLKKGVPENQLLLEKNSTTTQENLRYTSKLLKEHRIPNVYLVTHDYHMHRALHMAKEEHIIAAPAPTHSSVLFMPFHKTRECYALLKMKLISAFRNSHIQ